MKVAILALLGNISAIQLAGPNSMVQTQSESKMMAFAAQLKIKEFNSLVQDLAHVTDNIQSLGQTEAEQKATLTRHHHKIHKVVSTLSNGLDSGCGNSTQYVVVQSVSYPCMQSIPDLSNKVSNISMKIPLLGAMEHRLGLMNSLDPELKSINKELDAITSFDDMRAAAKGGEIIKQHL